MRRRQDFKIIVGQVSNNYTAMLFNLATDPSETTDIAGTAEGKAKVAELLGAFREMAKGAGVAHDRDPIDPLSNPALHGGAWMPWDGPE